MSRRRKRRKISSPRRHRRRKRHISPSSDVSSDEGPTSLDLERFRLQLACFLLAVNPLHKARNSGAMYWSDYDPSLLPSFPLSDLPAPNVPPYDFMIDVLERPAGDELKKILMKLVKLIVEEKGEVYANQRTSRAVRQSASGHGPRTNRQLLGQLLKRYRTDQLVWFFEAFGYDDGSVLGAPLDVIRKFGKVRLVDALVEIFLIGSLSHGRREEERKVLEEMTPSDFMNLQFELCGTVVPRELVVEILEFRGYDYQLICSVGCVSWDLYALILSTWNAAIRVSKHNLFSIPKIVFSCAREVCVSSPTDDVMVVKELRYLYLNLPRNTLRELHVPASVGTKAGVRYLKYLWMSAKKSGAFDRLQKILLSSSYSPLDVTLRPFVLRDLAPNLRCVRDPFSARLCEGLTHLSELEISLRCVENQQDLSALASLLKMSTAVGLTIVDFRLPLDWVHPVLEALFGIDRDCRLKRLELVFFAFSAPFEQFFSAMDGHDLKFLSIRLEDILGTRFSLDTIPQLSCLKQVLFQPRRGGGRGFSFMFPFSLKFQLRFLEASMSSLSEIHVSVPVHNFQWDKQAVWTKLADCPTPSVMKEELDVLLDQIPRLRCLAISSEAAYVRFVSGGRRVYAKVRILKSKVIDQLDWIVDQLLNRCSGLRMFEAVFETYLTHADAIFGRIIDHVSLKMNQRPDEQTKERVVWRFC